MTDKTRLKTKDLVVVLQNRWKICERHIVYYGIRKAPHTFENSVRLSRKTLGILKKLDGKISLGEAGVNFQIRKLLRQKILVPKEEFREIPHDVESARFCGNCVANDYMIPGLELDENGLCPLCAGKAKLKKLRSVLPVVNEFPRNEKGDYDVAVFYTGGKDSTFLLYYLAVRLKLRVLALTWVTDYMSESAKKSVANAKKLFVNVRFEEKKLSSELTSRIYRRHFELAGNTCMCPSLAYVLFFETLVKEKAPYLVLGNEPVQMLNLLFNNMSPAIAFRAGWQVAGAFLFNVGRLLTFRKPLGKGKMQTYFTMRTLAKGPVWAKDPEGKYQNEQIHNVFEALKEAPEIMKPFENCLKKSFAKGEFPALVHVDFNEVADGYDWNGIKNLIEKEAAWIGADGKGLHTSCDIEKCKEYSQLVRFREMRSRVVPYSAIELSLAVSSGSVTREDAMRELSEQSGFSGCEKEWEIMTRPLKNGTEDIHSSERENT